MGKTFENRGIRADGRLLPKKDYRPFCDIEFDLTRALSKYGPEYVRRAEELLDKPYPQLDATLYMQFARNGNRSNFEGPYFERRVRTQLFALAELYERKGRFTDKYIDGIWHILEESTWVLPAHNATSKNHPGTPLPDAFSTGPDDDMQHIDLFSAGTAGCVAWLWYLTGELTDAEAPVIRERMLAQLRQRILHPFYTYDHDWWMGARGQSLNNWTPWIISNVLTVVAFCEDDDEKRVFAVNKCMDILDRFTGPYPEDGGCDEGPGYWGVAGASYYDCAELLYDLSGGKIDIFDEPLLRKMCEYIMNFCITDGTWVNFSDAAAHLHPSFRLIRRMGVRLSSPALAAFATTIIHGEDQLFPNHAQAHAFYRNLFEETPAPEAYLPPEKILYPNLQVAISREPDNGLFLALKGGSNAESHNHNDVGQFLLFDKGEPVIMDAGVETYCRDTFSNKRYTLWAMRGSYHNVANIGGVEEQPGGQFRAETLSYEEDTGRLTLELKNAYPAEAGIVSYKRSAVLSDGKVTVTDDFALTEEKEIALHYITVDKPEFAGNEIRFASGHTAVFDAALTPSLDEIPLNNGKIGREWKRESLWRITLQSKPVKNAVWVLTFKKP